LPGVKTSVEQARDGCLLMLAVIALLCLVGASLWRADAQPDQMPDAKSGMVSMLAMVALGRRVLGK
jgi:hypothetical protein